MRTVQQLFDKFERRAGNCLAMLRVHAEMAEEIAPQSFLGTDFIRVQEAMVEYAKAQTSFGKAYIDFRPSMAKAPTDQSSGFEQKRDALTEAMSNLDGFDLETYTTALNTYHIKEFIEYAAHGQDGIKRTITALLTAAAKKRWSQQKDTVSQMNPTRNPAWLALMRISKVMRLTIII